MKTAQKVFYNAFVTFSARFVVALIGLFIVWQLTHYLGLSSYGKYETVLAYLFTFITIADLGLYPVLLREISLPKAKEEIIYGNVLTIRLISLITAGLIAILALNFFPYDQETKAGVFLAFGFFIFASITQILVPLFQKRLAMYKVAFSEVSARLINLILVLTLIYLKAPLKYFFLALALTAFSHTLLTYLFARKYIKIKLYLDWQKIKFILKESIPLGLSVVFIMVYFRLDQVMLSYFKPPEDVGIYGLSFKILENIIFFPGMLIGLITPILAKNVLNKEKFLALIQRSFDLFTILSFGTVLTLIYFSNFIIGLIAPETFLPSAQVLKILSFALFFIFFGNLFGYLIVILGKQKVTAFIYLLGAILNFFLNLYFIPKYSYFGAAGTTLFTEALVNSLLAFFAIKYLGANLSFKNFLKVILVFLALTPLAFLTKKPEILGIIVLGIFLLTLIIFKVIAKSDLEIIKGFKFKL